MCSAGLEAVCSAGLARAVSGEGLGALERAGC